MLIHLSWNKEISRLNCILTNLQKLPQISVSCKTWMFSYALFLKKFPSWSIQIKKCWTQIYEFTDNDLTEEKNNAYQPLHIKNTQYLLLPFLIFKLYFNKFFFTLKRGNVPTENYSNFPYLASSWHGVTFKHDRKQLY